MAGMANKIMSRIRRRWDLSPDLTAHDVASDVARPLQWITALVVVLCVAATANAGINWEPLKNKIRTRLNDPDARISLCYQLDRTRWTRFSLPRNADHVRIITNANIPETAPLDPESPMHYTLFYELRDGRDAVLKSGTYHHTTRITSYGDAAGKAYTAAYYFDAPVMPADGRVMHLDFTGIPHDGPLTMRFRLVAGDPVIADVVMRLYYPETTTEGKLEHMWKRTGRAGKKALARGNVYPEDFLSHTEQINLMRRQLRPLAPDGSDGTDYITRRMYVRKSITDAPVPDQADFVKGLPLNDHLRVTFPVPDQGMKLRFLFSRSPARDDAGSPHIGMKWHAHKKDVASWEIPWQGDETRYDRSFSQAGLVELTADRPLSVIIFRLDGDQATDITPDPPGTRVWPMDSSTPVSYQIFHARGLPTPFRFTFRKEMHPVQPAAEQGHGKQEIPGQPGNEQIHGKQMPHGGPAAEQIHMECLDKARSVLEQKTLTARFTPSLYDRRANPAAPSMMSDPVRFYFRFPPETTHVRFSAKRSLLISAHNRPPGMVKQTRVPEDYEPAPMTEPEKTATWFPVAPLPARNAPVVAETAFIKFQKRPRPPTPDLSAGPFRWESLTPEKNKIGHYLLEPAAETSYRRQASLGARFTPVLRNRPRTMTFTSPGRLTRLTPRLVLYPSRDRTPFDVRITMDGHPYYERSFMGRTGAVTLPPLAAGRHRVHLQSSLPLQAFMNLIESEKTMPPGKSGQVDRFLRFAHPLTPEGTIFAYPRTTRADETLSVAVFFPMMHPQRCELTITVKGPFSRQSGPFTGLTTTRRRYSIRSDPNGPVYVLNASRPVLGSRQRCFFPIREDLPPGNYTVEVVLKKGPGGYVLPYRVTPGVFPVRKLFREVNL